MGQIWDKVVPMIQVKSIKSIYLIVLIGARGGNRTHTHLRETDFKSVASTSSATRAVMLVKWRLGTESKTVLYAPTLLSLEQGVQQIPPKIPRYIRPTLTKWRAHYGRSAPLSEYQMERTPHIWPVLRFKADRNSVYAPNRP